MCESIKSYLECGDALNLCHTDSDLGPLCLNSPVSGNYIPMSEIPDPSFSKGCFGDCAAVLTEDRVVCAPCDGEIVAIAREKHGLGILNADHSEILIQVGIGTEKLGGEGFLPLVCIGDVVEAGDRILQFDPDVIKEAGYQPIVVVVRMDD